MRGEAKPAGEGDQKTWTVVVVHEDAETRETAMSFCNTLISKVWAGLNIDVGWWTYQALAGETGATAVTKASEADFVIFASRPGKELPLEVKHWVSQWEKKRPEREGAIVGLTTPAVQGASTEPHLWLRQLAHRTGMDYLTSLPAELCVSMPESTEYWFARAKEMTSVMDGILKQHPAPRTFRL